MKLKILFVLSLFFVGCSKEGLRQEQSDNPNFSVQKLFTHDGCTVYRFFDAERIYYVNCLNGSSHAMWSDMHGKINSKHEVTTGTVLERVE